ncbi:MAG: ThiF family adenylyltransferase [Cryobacterium sp.]|nr:ThiF family adenylyltransferase [Cryobacterium sp.]
MTLVAHSPDLQHLVEDGFDVEVRDGNLLIHHVPFVNSEGEVTYGILVSELSTNGEQAIVPGRHEVWVVGGVPHDHQGDKILIIADEEKLDYGDGLVASCRLSGKPHGEMPRDYHHKITNYVDLLGRYARVIDSTATFQHYPARESSEEESVFKYHDAATSRAGLSAITAKLRAQKVAIVGLGGTGSYVLDLIAKTPIVEIHLYDDDVLYAHNAFRAPGAASLDELRQTPSKVQYFSEKYDPMRRNIVPHASRITEDNIGELAGFDFVFLTMDAGPAKRTIVETLSAWGQAFIDCGMGVQREGNALRGTLRITAAIPGHFDHLARRVSYTDVEADEYDWNIQTADLNMMNAAMAVLKWKKLAGYYVDRKQELNTTFVVGPNALWSGETLS